MSIQRVTDEPTIEDFYRVSEVAQDECDCTEEQQTSDLLKEVSCVPCACRQVLNSIASLAEKI